MAGIRQTTCATISGVLTHGDSAAERGGEVRAWADGGGVVVPDRGNPQATREEGAGVQALQCASILHLRMKEDNGLGTMPDLAWCPLIFLLSLCLMHGYF